MTDAADNTSPARKLMMKKGQTECDTYSTPFANTKCKACSKFFVKAGGLDGLIKHYEKDHPRRGIQWACGKCGSTNYISYLSCNQHTVRCKGPQEALPVRCKSCKRTFKNLVGLNLHIRSAHPRVMNDCVKEEAAATTSKGSKARAWTNSELEQFDRLMLDYGHERGYCMKISNILQTKTAKQVADRARIWRGGRRVRNADNELELSTDSTDSTETSDIETPRLPASGY